MFNKNEEGRPCIVDTNILIDLHKGEILHLLFALPLEVSAPDVVLHEQVEPDRKMLQGMGLGTISLSSTQLVEVVQLSTQDAGLSMGDCAAFIAARDKGWVLLTGDKRLRQKAEAAAVETHGVLWILDMIEDEGLLNSLELAVSLQKMIDHGARLPTDECDKRFRRWSSSS